MPLESNSHVLCSSFLAYCGRTASPDETRCTALYHNAHRNRCIERPESNHHLFSRRVASQSYQMDRRHTYGNMIFPCESAAPARQQHGKHETCMYHYCCSRIIPYQLMNPQPLRDTQLTNKKRVITFFAPSFLAAVRLTPIPTVAPSNTHLPSLVYTVETSSMSDCVCHWRHIDRFFGITRELSFFANPSVSSFLFELSVTGWRSEGYIQLTHRGISALLRRALYLISLNLQCLDNS